jgi:hypothetical protein
VLRDVRECLLYDAICREFHHRVRVNRRAVDVQRHLDAGGSGLREDLLELGERRVRVDGRGLLRVCRAQNAEQGA